MNINDYTYEPLHTDEQMDIAKKWLKDQTDKKFFYSTANFGRVMTNNEVRANIGDVCHAYMARYPLDAPVVLAVTEAFLHSKHRESSHGYRRYDKNGAFIPYEKSADLMMPFFEWLVYESVFGRFILNRDDRDSVERGFIVSAAVPSSIMQSLMILSRHFYEVCPESYEQFNKMREAGIPGSVAYPVCFNSSYGANTDYGVKEGSAVVIAKYGHRVMPLFTSLEHFQNFITGAAVGLFQTDSSYQSNPCTSGTASLFHPANIGGQPIFTSRLIGPDAEFTKALREYRGQGEGVASIINPFKRATGRTPSPTDVTYDELFNFVIPFLHARGDFKDAIH